jgi:hypothetical protein
MKHLQESKSLAVSQILWALVESFLQYVYKANYVVKSQG